jgi:hypothetical protein
MHWAKTRSLARFNLATSGIPNFPMEDFPMKVGDLEITGTGDYGYEPLLEAIAKKCNATTENIALAFGTSMANHLAMAALIEHNDEVLLEHPVYEPLTSAAQFLGARVSFFERKHENGFRIDADEIKKKLSPQAKLIVITNLHNPSSVFTDNETLKEIGAIAADIGARVLIDEVYLDVMFEDAPPSSFHLGGNFIVTNSLTKAFGLSGLRCGWILADKDLVQRIKRLNDLFGATNVHIGESLSLIALENLSLFRERAQKLLETNRALLNDFFDSRSDLDAVRTKYGTTSFPLMLNGNPKKFFSLLREKYETTVVPGEFFGLDQHFRLGVTCDTETLKGGLERLGAALDEMA